MKLLFLGVCLFISSLGLVVFAAEPSPTNPLVIILLGPPGSGKGTQAVRMSKELRIPHISTGDLFRENIGKNTELGKKAKTYTESGQLVPDQLVLEMVFDRVSKPDCLKGYLLDGCPRTVFQAEALEEHLKNVNHVVLNLDVSDEVIEKRIAGRLSGEKRKDDQPEVVKERLRVYHEQTEPVVEYYKKQNKLKTVDGNKTPDEVFTALMQVLNS